MKNSRLIIFFFWPFLSIQTALANMDACGEGIRENQFTEASKCNFGCLFAMVVEDNFKIGLDTTDQKSKQTIDQLASNKKLLDDYSLVANFGSYIAEELNAMKSRWAQIKNPCMRILKAEGGEIDERQAKFEPFNANSSRITNGILGLTRSECMKHYQGTVRKIVGPFNIQVSMFPESPQFEDQRDYSTIKDEMIKQQAAEMLQQLTRLRQVCDATSQFARSSFDLKKNQPTRFYKMLEGVYKNSDLQELELFRCTTTKDPNCDLPGPLARIIRGATSIPTDYIKRYKRPTGAN